MRAGTSQSKPTDRLKYLMCTMVPMRYWSQLDFSEHSLFSYGDVYGSPPKRRGSHHFIGPHGHSLFTVMAKVVTCIIFDENIPHWIQSQNEFICHKKSSVYCHDQAPKTPNNEDWCKIMFKSNVPTPHTHPTRPAEFGLAHCNHWSI